MTPTHQDINPPSPCVIATSVKELLSLHDEAFLRCAYATVLGRDPDPEGLSHFLARIRNGDNRLAILAVIRLSPEGQQRGNILPGLDRAVRVYRWRRSLLLGPILRLIGAGKDSVDTRHQIAAIEAKLSRLSKLVPPSRVTAQASEQRLRADDLQFRLIEQQARTDDLQLRLNETQIRADDLQLRLRETQTHADDLQLRLNETQIRADESRMRKSTTSEMTWRIGRNSGEAEDVSQVRVEMARALTELGLDLSPALPGSEADVTAVFGSPIMSTCTNDRPKLLVGHDWDESGYPADWVESLNDNFSGVACATNHAMKILIDHGVSIPLAAVGLGVDQWDRVFASPDYLAPGKSFRFLHVSSCSPGKGIDLLLESFGRVFNSQDDVSLVIKPTGVPPLELFPMLDRLRSANPDFPDVVLIEEKLTDADLKALYEKCHVFVAPSRAEGFGLPIAQALLSGLPVVATAWGGHLDYCDETNSWLIDYSFQRAKTPNDLTASVWAEPVTSSLDQAVRKAHLALPEERSAKAKAGRTRLLKEFMWKDVAIRLVALSELAKAKTSGKLRKCRVGWITTWNVKCGIATHVEHLLAEVPSDDFVVFAGRQEESLVGHDEKNCVRSWNLGKHSNGLDEIERQLKPWAVGALVIQFNYGFFSHFELNDFIERVLEKGTAVIVDLHSTVDPFGDTVNFRLADFLSAVRKCHRILAHSPADMDRLKALGLVKNVMLFPHGVMNNGLSFNLPARLKVPPLIASFGFFLPNKGLMELVEAVGLLKRKGTPVHLLMVNAEHPAEVSALEVRRVKEAIERLGLKNEVEIRTDFIEDEACIKLLEKADIVVNPYQITGESASGSARYGLTAGRPVAVTPLAIFDDLGDAVFRMPGTTPGEIAEGIARVLKQLKTGSEAARHVQDSARRWIDAHDYSRQANELMRTARNLATPKKVARGVFINTAKANCSIYESGRMVYSCVSESDHYTLDYFSLDLFDVPFLAQEGRIRPLDKSNIEKQNDLGEYDFWVFNWHFITMAPHLNLESIAKLPGLKFSIILELEPGDPLKLIPSDIFDGYIALDPTTPAKGKIFPFPRPLEGDPQSSKLPRDVPVIGSFGFGTPGKGFELLVEAVNREFDKAIVRVNIPKGAYTSSMDSIHRQEYSQYIAALCMRIAKPGIDVRFTNDFMSPEQLVDWCADNDLNCFMYTRRQSGLSATTDQAIMSGRPLITGSNDTFRHIHGYIPPYPVISLRQAIETTAPQVSKMQHDWSRTSFSKTFERMLATFDLVVLDRTSGNVVVASEEQRTTIMVACRRNMWDDDILNYSSRLADCLDRSGIYDVLRVSCNDFSELELQLTALRPSAVIMVDFFAAGRESLARALNLVTGPKILLAKDRGVAAAHFLPKIDGLLILEQRPLIPYYTPFIASQEEPPRIMLIGFASPVSNLEMVVAKISRERPGAQVFLEVPDSNKSEFEMRVAKLPERLDQANGLQLVVVSLPVGGDKIIRMFVENRLTVFYNDLDRTEELESVSSLAMTTERSVVFTRAAPFRHFLAGGTYVEDLAITDIMNLGMGAQIKLCHEFGEGRLYAKIRRVLSKEFAGVRAEAQRVVQAF